jgi:hypothetical protein
MAGNGQATLQINQYPEGIDNTQRSLIVKGTALITKSTPTLGVIVSFSITSNVATLTLLNASSFTTGGGDVVTVANFTGTYSYLNGTYTTNSATATTVLIPLTHANVASTAVQGLVFLQPTYITGGIPILYTFSNPATGSTQIPDLGNGALPSWIEFKTLAGSALNYKVNLLTPSSPLLLIFTGITQISDSTAITADTVGFRAEFPRGVGGSGY